MLKTKNAITLIALIITILVLLALAGVTINMVLGENGLFNKAKTSVGKSENAQYKENSALAGYETDIDNASRETITISREELSSIVSEEVQRQLNVNRIYPNITYNNTYIDSSKSWVTIQKIARIVRLDFCLSIKADITNQEVTLFTGVPVPSEVVTFNAITTYDYVFAVRMTIYANSQEVKLSWAKNTVEPRNGNNTLMGSVTYFAKD